MAPVNNVTRMLAAKGIVFEAHELPGEKLSGLEAAAHLGIDPAQMYKTIVAIRPDGGKPVLGLIPAAAQVELKALGRALGGKKLQLASMAQAETLTGLQTGGISPLALVAKGFEVVVDSSALEHAQIYLSGGQRDLNISLAPQSLLELTHAKTAEIAAIS